MNSTDYAERYGNLIYDFKVDGNYKSRKLSDLDKEFLALHRQWANIVWKDKDLDRLRDVIYRGAVYSDCQSSISASAERIKAILRRNELDNLRRRPVRFTRLAYKGC